MREARWLQDPTIARGIVKTFFESIRQSGMVPGRLYMTGLPTGDFCHADWVVVSRRSTRCIRIVRRSERC